MWRTVIIGITVVMFWRGAWGLMDLYLLPNHEVLSYIASMALGLGLLFLVNKHHLKDLG